MGQISNLKRIVIEEFPAEHRKWLTNLVGPLNDFFKVIYQTLNKGITFADNIQSQTKDLYFTYSSIYPSKTNPVRFQNSMPVKPIGVILLSVQDVSSDPAVISNAVYLDWLYNGQDVEIRNITGLTVGTSYKMKVLTIGG
jgi:hypothetical protein